VRYPCSHCDYVATQASNLKKHVESKHEGVRYPCSHCDYVSTTVQNLKSHFKKKHGR